jgi:hypothetical protein
MTAEHPRVAIAVPSGDMVHADFALALAGLCHASGALDVVIFSNKSSIVAEARNNGVAMAQDAGADQVLFLDSDMIFPRTALRRLLDHGLDIVGATYAKRVPPFQALGNALPQQPADAPPGLIEMARIPTGCLLIRMTVFDRLSKPYFHFGVDTARGLIVGEDYMFCDRARAAGLRIWCDGILSRALGHIGQQVRRLED